jgi:hypothetical protein
MYDYVKSRPAKVGEKLRTHRFHPGIIGFAAPEDASTAVRVLSGTELAFATTIRCSPRSLFAKGTADLLVGGSGSNGASASSATSYSG